MKQHSSRLLPIYVAIAVIVGVLIGNFYGSHFSGRRVSLINTSSNKLSDLLHIIGDEYVDSISITDLVEKSLPQILKELDPHSTYISAEEAEASMQDLKGSFSGIGVQFTIYDDTVRVVKVIDGGPSQRAGLQAGDRIVNIDDKTYVGDSLNNEETMKRLKGPADTQVKLGIIRAREPKMLTYTIQRGAVPVKSIDASYMIDKTTGYIRINSWGDTTYSEFVSAMTSLNAKGLQNLVIDLRGNLGGYLTAATQIANEFLPDDRLIVYTQGRRYPREDFKSNGRGTYQTLPLVVLVDETSASASEIFAGAMQDNDRAIIVGRRTFGKGLVQVPFEFRDGSIVRLTRARYYTPSGRCVQKPYTPGDEEAYENDLIARAEAGEYFTSDSIKTDGEKFKTRLGRTVYGGGGIIPDHFIGRDTIGYTSYFKDVVMNGQMAQFAYYFVDQHRQEMNKLSSHEEVTAYLNRINVVEEFATYADKNGTKRRNLMIMTSHSLLQRFLTSYIISDILETQDAVIFNNLSDPTVLKALEVIRNGQTFPTGPKEAVAAARTLPQGNHDSRRLQQSGRLVCIAGRRPHRLMWL